MTTETNELVYGVIDAPGHSGDTVTCWDTYATPGQAVARAKGPGMMAVAGASLEKGRKYTRAGVADLLSAGNWRRL